MKFVCKPKLTSIPLFNTKIDEIKDLGSKNLFRRRKRFKRSEDEKKVITAYLQGDQTAINAAEHMFRTQQQYGQGENRSWIGQNHGDFIAP